MPNVPESAHVYLWLPDALAPESSSSFNLEYSCRYSSGRYLKTPCVADGQISIRGQRDTVIETIPSGALLLLDGIVIAKTPALLVLQQPADNVGVSGITSAKIFALYVKKEGYEEGSINIRDGSSVKIKLNPKNPVAPTK